MALDVFNIPKSTGNADVFYFQGVGVAAGTDWITWEKPRGKGMVNIVLVGKGGNGGSGAIGGASAASGGGGGGSGGQTQLTMPLALLPDYLYISLAGIAPGITAQASYIVVEPKLTAGAGAPVANNTLMIANGGSGGGNAAGATVGAVGNGGTVATAATMPLGWNFSGGTAFGALAGQNGIIGNAAAGGALTLPVTGLWVTGGTGGAGVGNAGSTGSAGGNITGAGVFPTSAGGLAAGSQTAPPGSGQHGFTPRPGLTYYYGGTGGGSTGGSSTGAGLVQSSGGNGAPGCGGGASGGAFTGSTPGVAGLGGPAFCIITVW